MLPKAKKPEGLLGKAKKAMESDMAAGFLKGKAEEALNDRKAKQSQIEELLNEIKNEGLPRKEVEPNV